MVDRNHHQNRCPRVHAFCAFAVAATSTTFLNLTITAAHAQTDTLTALATFNGTGNGAISRAGLIMDSSGNLYGTTSKGGANNDGTVFEIAAGTSAVTTLATFNGTGNGQNPLASLVMDSSGDLYGTTELGGANNDGTVFEIAANSRALSTLTAFNGAGNGSFAEGGLTIDSSGSLYGTTQSGGANNDGTIFEIAAGNSALTTLAAFTNSSGSWPYAGVTRDSNGNLYGTTRLGGANGDGTVFEVAANTGIVTTLATLSNAAGATPYGGVVLDSSGNLYGTTQSAGMYGYGTLFEVAAGTDTLTTLVAFNYSDGARPYSSLTFDSGGNLYGTTSAGGVNGAGTIFEIAVGTSTLTTLASFDDTGNGTISYSNVLLDGNGNLYGTTAFGGANNDGTVFKLVVNGAASAPEPAALALLLPFAMSVLAAARRKLC